MTGEASRSGSLSFGRITRSAHKLKQRRVSRHHILLLSLLLVLPLSLVGTRAFSRIDAALKKSGPGELRHSINFGANPNPAPVGVNSTVIPAAMSFTVNTTDDHDDGSCTVTDCTLREAINAANTNAGDDTIDFAVYGDVNLTQALPVISESVTINGPPPRTGGGSFIQIVRHTGGDYRIFTITTSGTVTLHTLALRNGNVTGGAGVGDGGAIYNAVGGTLNLINVTFIGNHASNGGAVANDSSGTV